MSLKLHERPVKDTPRWGSHGRGYVGRKKHLNLTEFEFGGGEPHERELSWFLEEGFMEVLYGRREVPGAQKSE